MGAKKRNTVMLFSFSLLFISTADLFVDPSFRAWLVILGVFVFFLAFIKPRTALVILILSMLLSPEFVLGDILGREVKIRIDDIFLFIIFLGWLAHISVNKEESLFRPTSLNKPILIYIFVCILATAIGALQRTTDVNSGAFYIIKYIEYFLVYFMVSNNVTSKRQVKMFVFFLLFTCFLVTIYAISTVGTYGGRATAPFEGEAGEANTLAGYLIFIGGIVLGVFLYTRSGGQKLLLGFLLVMIFRAFINTLSRGGYLAAIGMYITCIIFSKRHKVLLIAFAVGVMVLGPVFFPQRVFTRINEIFSPGKTYKLFGQEMTVDESTSARLDSWAYAFQTLGRYPLFGRGVPGGGSVAEVQYARVIKETGIIGFIVFCWLIVTLLKNAREPLRETSSDDFMEGLVFGYFCGLAGILFMSLSAEVFIVIRVMEPFWFVTALISMMPYLSETE